MRKFLMLLAGLGLLLGWGLPVRAQAGAEVDLYPADASAFPTISSFLDVFDVSGRFVSGLKPEQVTILEDGQPLALKALNEMVVPLQLAVAINPGPGFDVRDRSGAARFDAVHNALTQWAQALPADTPDDMSLATISGPIIAHASAKDWLVSLEHLPAGLPGDDAQPAVAPNCTRYGGGASAARRHETRRAVHHAAHG